MSMNYSFFLMSLFFCIFVAFCFWGGHLLFSLLLLEMAILVSVLGFVGVNFVFSFNLIFLLSVAVCEAAIGLALLVRLMRSHGNDYLKVSNFLRW